MRCIDRSHQIHDETSTPTAIGYLTATLATFFIDRDAESDDVELASAKSIQALQTEINELRTDIQALVRRDLDSAKRTLGER